MVGERVERNRLPEDAEEIAERYVQELPAPTLRRPLERFLTTVITVPYLEAVALSITEEEGHGPHFNVYAFRDNTKLGEPVFDQSGATVGDLYNQMRRSVNVDRNRWGISLSFVPTGGLPLEQGVAPFVRNLQTGGRNPFNIWSPLKSGSVITIAEIAPPSLTNLD